MRFTRFLLLAAAALIGTLSAAHAQVMTVAIPQSRVVASITQNAVLEPSESNVTVFVSNRTVTNSAGQVVSAIGRVTDLLITNGGNSVCYIAFTDVQGNLLLSEIAVAGGSTTNLSFFNGPPVVFGQSFRAVRSDFFGSPCTSRLAITARGFFYYNE